MKKILDKVLLFLVVPLMSILAFAGMMIFGAGSHSHNHNKHYADTWTQSAEKTTGLEELDPIYGGVSKIVIDDSGIGDTNDYNDQFVNQNYNSALLNLYGDPGQPTAGFVTGKKPYILNFFAETGGYSGGSVDAFEITQSLIPYNGNLENGHDVVVGNGLIPISTTNMSLAPLTPKHRLKTLTSAWGRYYYTDEHCSNHWWPEDHHVRSVPSAVSYSPWGDGDLEEFQANEFDYSPSQPYTPTPAEAYIGTLQFGIDGSSNNLNLALRNFLKITPRADLYATYYVDVEPLIDNGVNNLNNLQLERALDKEGVKEHVINTQSFMAMDLFALSSTGDKPGDLDQLHVLNVKLSLVPKHKVTANYYRSDSTSAEVTLSQMLQSADSSDTRILYMNGLSAVGGKQTGHIGETFVGWDIDWVGGDGSIGATSRVNRIRRLVPNDTTTAFRKGSDIAISYDSLGRDSKAYDATKVRDGFYYTVHRGTVPDTRVVDGVTGYDLVQGGDLTFGFIAGTATKGRPFMPDANGEIANIREVWESNTLTISGVVQNPNQGTGTVGPIALNPIRYYDNEGAENSIKWTQLGSGSLEWSRVGYYLDGFSIGKKDGVYWTPNGTVINGKTGKSEINIGDVYWNEGSLDMKNVDTNLTVQLHPVWIEKKFKINYNRNYGPETALDRPDDTFTLASDNTYWNDVFMAEAGDDVFTYNSDFYMPKTNPTRSGFTFTGWELSYKEGYKENTDLSASAGASNVNNNNKFRDERLYKKSYVADIGKNGILPKSYLPMNDMDTIPVDYTRGYNSNITFELSAVWEENKVVLDFNGLSLDYDSIPSVKYGEENVVFEIRKQNGETLGRHIKYVYRYQDGGSNKISFADTNIFRKAGYTLVGWNAEVTLRNDTLGYGSEGQADDAEDSDADKWKASVIDATNNFRRLYGNGASGIWDELDKSQVTTNITTLDIDATAKSFEGLTDNLVLRDGYRYTVVKFTPIWSRNRLRVNYYANNDDANLSNYGNLLPVGEQQLDGSYTDVYTTYLVNPCPEHNEILEGCATCKPYLRQDEFADLPAGADADDIAFANKYKAQVLGGFSTAPIVYKFGDYYGDPYWSADNNPNGNGSAKSAVGDMKDLESDLLVGIIDAKGSPEIKYKKIGYELVGWVLRTDSVSNAYEELYAGSLGPKDIGKMQVRYINNLSSNAHGIIGDGLGIGSIYNGSSYTNSSETFMMKLFDEWTNFADVGNGVSDDDGTEFDWSTEPSGIYAGDTEITAYPIWKARNYSLGFYADYTRTINDEESDYDGKMVHAVDENYIYEVEDGEVRESYSTGYWNGLHWDRADVNGTQGLLDSEMINLPDGIEEGDIDKGYIVNNRLFDDGVNNYGVEGSGRREAAYISRDKDDSTSITDAGQYDYFTVIPPSDNNTPNDTSDDTPQKQGHRYTFVFDNTGENPWYLPIPYKRGHIFHTWYINSGESVLGSTATAPSQQVAGYIVDVYGRPIDANGYLLKLAADQKTLALDTYGNIEYDLDSNNQKQKGARPQKYFVTPEGYNDLREAVADKEESSGILDRLYAGFTPKVFNIEYGFTDYVSVALPAKEIKNYAGDVVVKVDNNKKSFYVVEDFAQPLNKYDPVRFPNYFVYGKKGQAVGRIRNEKKPNNGGYYTVEEQNDQYLNEVYMLTNGEDVGGINPDGTVSTVPDGIVNRSEDANNNGIFDRGETWTDTNGNGKWDSGEKWVDANENGIFDADEDVNGNERFDTYSEVEKRLFETTIYETINYGAPKEDVNGNGELDWGEDLDMDYELDYGEDANMNGQLDPGEDSYPYNGVLDGYEDVGYMVNGVRVGAGNGLLDGVEDLNGNKLLDDPTIERNINQWFDVGLDPYFNMVSWFIQGGPVGDDKQIRGVDSIPNSIDSVSEDYIFQSGDEGSDESYYIGEINNRLMFNYSTFSGAEKSDVDVYKDDSIKLFALFTSNNKITYDYTGDLIELGGDGLAALFDTDGRFKQQIEHSGGQYPTAYNINDPNDPFSENMSSENKGIYVDPLRNIYTDRAGNLRSHDDYLRDQRLLEPMREGIELRAAFEGWSIAIEGGNTGYYAASDFTGKPGDIRDSMMNSKIVIPSSLFLSPGGDDTWTDPRPVKLIADWAIQTIQVEFKGALDGSIDENGNVKTRTITRGTSEGALGVKLATDPTFLPAKPVLNATYNDKKDYKTYLGGDYGIFNEKIYTGDVKWERFDTISNKLVSFEKDSMHKGWVYEAKWTLNAKPFWDIQQAIISSGYNIRYPSYDQNGDGSVELFSAITEDAGRILVGGTRGPWTVEYDRRAEYWNVFDRLIDYVRYNSIPIGHLLSAELFDKDNLLYILEILEEYKKAYDDMDNGGNELMIKLAGLMNTTAMGIFRTSLETLIKTEIPLGITNGNDSDRQKGIIKFFDTYNFVNRSVDYGVNMFKRVPATEMQLHDFKRRVELLREYESLVDTIPYDTGIAESSLMDYANSILDKIRLADNPLGNAPIYHYELLGYEENITSALQSSGKFNGNLQTDDLLYSDDGWPVSRSVTEKDFEGIGLFASSRSATEMKNVIKEGILDGKDVISVDGVREIIYLLQEYQSELSDEKLNTYLANAESLLMFSNDYTYSDVYQSIYLLGLVKKSVMGQRPSGVLNSKPLDAGTDTNWLEELDRLVLRPLTNYDLASIDIDMFNKFDDASDDSDIWHEAPGTATNAMARKYMRELIDFAQKYNMVDKSGAIMSALNPNIVSDKTFYDLNDNIMAILKEYYLDVIMGTELETYMVIVQAAIDAHLDMSQGEGRMVEKDASDHIKKLKDLIIKLGKVIDTDIDGYPLAKDRNTPEYKDIVKKITDVIPVLRDLKEFKGDVLSTESLNDVEQYLSAAEFYSKTPGTLKAMTDLWEGYAGPPAEQGIKSLIESYGYVEGTDGGYITDDPKVNNKINAARIELIDVIDILRDYTTHSTSHLNDAQKVALKAELDAQMQIGEQAKTLSAINDARNYLMQLADEYIIPEDNGFPTLLGGYNEQKKILELLVHDMKSYYESMAEGEQKEMFNAQIYTGRAEERNPYNEDEIIVESFEGADVFLKAVNNEGREVTDRDFFDVRMRLERFMTENGIVIPRTGDATKGNDEGDESQMGMIIGIIAGVTMLGLAAGAIPLVKKRLGKKKGEVVEDEIEEEMI